MNIPEPGTMPYISIELDVQIKVVTVWRERNMYRHYSVRNAVDDVFQRMVRLEDDGLGTHWYLQMMNTHHLLLRMQNDGGHQVLIEGTRNEIWHALKAHLHFMRTES